MAKFKINKNKPDLPDEQIFRHKDFGKLLDNHQKITKYKDATKPLYKNPGFLSFMVVLSVVLITWLITEREGGESKAGKNKKGASKEIIIKENVTDSSAKPSDTTLINKNGSKTINEEVKNAIPSIEYSSYKIDPKKGAVVYHKSTRIIIPPFAFKDVTGSIIQNEIEIKYREFRDPVEIYLAGIPMHYDSTGKNLNLESAGMFEIKGYSGAQLVYIKTPITVEMTNPEHGNKYNSYYYNEKNKKWEYEGKEQQSMRFMVSADEQQYPELKPFKGMIWEFSVNAQQKDPNQFRHIFSKTWSSFFVNESAVLNSKDVKLKQNSSEPKFLASPIPVLNDEEANKKLMKAKFDEYYSLLKKKEKQDADLSEALRRQQEWLNSPQGKAYLEWAKSDNGQKSILSSRVVSVFTVGKFGIWNCDRPINNPEVAKLTASFTDQNGKKLELDNYCLVDYSINSVITYYKGVDFKFNPKSNNILWASLPGGQLAVYSKEKFKKIPTSGAYTFKMDVIDINGKSTEQVKELLEMKNHITAKQELKDNDPVATYKRLIQLKKPGRDNDIFYAIPRADSTSSIIEIDNSMNLRNRIKGNKIK